jgi:hypothetical protein
MASYTNIWDTLGGVALILKCESILRAHIKITIMELNFFQGAHALSK